MKKSIYFILLVVLMFCGTEGGRAQCASFDPPKGDHSFRNVTHFVLDENTRFKIALATDLDSEFSKTGDAVLFTVLENVYGVSCDYDSSGKPTDFDNKRIIVIPEKSKIFGTVDYARSGFPFWIGGPAKLFIFVTSVKLESGFSIPLRFAVPEGAFFNKLSPKQREKLERVCKTADFTSCITGRRAKFKLSTAIIAGVAGGIATILKDVETGAVVGGFTFLQSATDKGGEILNAPQAKLLANKSIYEVATTREYKGFVLKSKEERDYVDPLNVKKRELDAIKTDNDLFDQRKKAGCPNRTCP